MAKILDKSTHYVIFITLVVIGAAIVGLLLLRSGHRINEGGSPPAVSDHLDFDQTLTAGGLSIPVATATTPAAQQQGLSDTPSLPANSGMLFIFSVPSNYGFWMKDMNYALDFVWLDSHLDIIGITSNVTADTYPKVFYCDQTTCANGKAGQVQYVLEVNSGFSTTHNLKIGEQFTLHSMSV
jgi:uncharacterized membrane protein (UPF0127 family)